LDSLHGSDIILRATDKNEDLLSLLRDLSGRVDEEDRLRIEKALDKDVS
jgi:hypothetical protein